MKKYGIMLELYAGQPFNMWVWGSGDSRFETTDSDEAYAMKRKCETANPKGFYDVKEIC